jgi:hypothetical protein
LAPSGAASTPTPASAQTPVEPTVAPTAGPALDPTELAALQAVLSGEHAAVWAYGVLGPRAGTGMDQARNLMLEHARTRDDLRRIVVEAGGEPVPAEPAYALPIEPVDPTSAAQLAALVEDRLAAVYADLVAAALDPRLRSLAVTGVITCTDRVVTWRGTVSAFPGMPERAGSSPSGSSSGPVSSSFSASPS